MPLIIRLGDTGSHGGAVISSAAKWRCEGMLIARKGDLYACPLHGVNRILTGSEKWRCENADIARQGDVTECGSSLISGAAKWACE